jgi:hypothetical protein
LLVFGLLLPDDGAYSVQPVRFVGGTYQVRHKSALWWNVSARIEKLLVSDAPTNRNLPIPQWLRLSVDEALSQVLTLSHRNSILTVRPADGNTTTLRIFPPIDPTQYLYFGINNQGDGDTLITSADVDPIFPTPISAFPGGLPNINQSFGLDAKRKASRIEMDSGHPRQYAGLLATVKTYQVEWDFNLEQLQTFQDFFFLTLRNGSLPFTLTLPVDNDFAAVVVRFVGGRYSESYLPVDTFRVTATVDRIVEQSVTPNEAPIYPIWYSPTVNVTANRKLTSGDAGKMFVVNPALGQTINLHIYSNFIEFGLLVVGLGNVLITRGPFMNDLGEFGDTGVGTFHKLSFELRTTDLDIGTLTGDTGVGEFLKLGFALVSTTHDIGTIPGDTGVGTFLKPSFEMLTVLEDLGEFGDTGAGEFLKLGFELI